MIRSLSRTALAVALFATGAFALGYDFADSVPASQSPPANLSVSQVPQFVCIGFDDNAYSGLTGSGGDGGMTWATNLFASKTNPPGSGNPGTLDGKRTHASFFMNSCYVGDWYSESPTYVKRAWHTALLNGNDVGNHTHSHTGGQLFTQAQWVNEMQTCNDWLKKPFSANESVNNPDGSKGVGASDAGIIGFRAPYLGYSLSGMRALKELGFTYDCSIQEGWDSAQNGTNYLWPYTLDNGSPGSVVLEQMGQGPRIGKIPGLWEMGVHPVIVPPDSKCAQYGITYSLRNKVKNVVPAFNVADGKITALDYNLFVVAQMTKAEALATLKYTLDLRLAGNRAPFMFGCHSDEYSSKYNYAPNATTRERQQVVEEYLAYALSKSNVRVASMSEIIDWMRNPTPLTVPDTVYHTINAGIVPHELDNGDDCDDPAWSATAIYGGGNYISYKGHQYWAKWWNQNRRPDINSNGIGEDCWNDMGSCGDSAVTAYYGTVTPLGAVRVKDGANQSFSITPDAGCHIVDVYVDSISVGPVATYTFDAVDGDHSIVADFASGIIDTTWLIVASAGLHGSISPTGSATVKQGSSKTYTINPSSGYVISNVSVDGLSVGIPASYTFSNISGNHTIRATFKLAPPMYTLTASAGANGRISPIGTVTVPKGYVATYTITPNSGYLIDAVIIDGVNRGALSTYTFSNVSGHHTIRATFKVAPKTWTITAIAGANGKVAPNGNTLVADSASLTVVITPKTGYVVNNVTVNGVNVGNPSSYTFYTVTANYTIRATFKVAPVSFPIVSSAGTGGRISPAGTLNVTTGISMGYAMTADTGYALDSLIVDGVSIPPVSNYVFANVTGPHTIRVTFKVVPTYYTITASAGKQGIITPSGIDTVLRGSTRTFRITADSGFVVDSLIVDGKYAGEMNTYTFNSISSSHTLKVVFKLAPVYTITAFAGVGGKITPSGAIAVARGTTKDFAITASQGFVIENVIVDGDNLGYQTSYRFYTVTENHTINVSFKVAQPSFVITGISGVGGRLMPDGTTNVGYGTSRTFTITPDSIHYIADVKVDGVSVGKVSSYTFGNITANHTIEAFFTPMPWNFLIQTYTSPGGTISPNGTVSVSRGASQMFTLIPDSGYAVDVVRVDGVNVSPAPTYTFRNVRADHVIAVGFVPLSYNPCDGVPAWEETKWASYKIGDCVTSNNSKWQCTALSWCQYDPAGPYGSYSWEFVSECR